MPWPMLRAPVKTRHDARRHSSERQRRLCIERLESRHLCATLPAGFVEVPAAVGLNAPTAMDFAPNGDLWVLEQDGPVKRFRSGSPSADVVGSVAGLGLNSVGERGLLGIAFDPEYATNKLVYLYYTTTSGGLHNRISRFTVNDSDSADYFFAGTDTLPIDAGSSGTPSETVIFDLDGLSASNHNGGAIHFGPDGKLYAAVGDNAVSSNSQSLANLHGKILRIHRDGTVPNDNPFFGVTTDDERAIWALGLRNPFTFAFQPNTGRMFINDVGQVSFEEFSDGMAGANFGWPNVEGNQGTPPSGPGTYVGPIYTYGRGTGPFEGFAITGGTFYNPPVQQFPAEFVGDYFFSDFGTSWINVLDVTSGVVSQFAIGASNPVDLKVDGTGGLYYLSRGTGQAVRISSTTAPSPNPFPWHNPRDEFDVDDDGEQAPLDALLIINYLNAGNDSNLPALPPGVVPEFFYDVQPDNFVAPLDALLIINHLNSLISSGEGEGIGDIPDWLIEESLSLDGTDKRKRR